MQVIYFVAREDVYIAFDVLNLKEMASDVEHCAAVRETGEVANRACGNFPRSRLQCRIFDGGGQELENGLGAVKKSGGLIGFQDNRVGENLQQVSFGAKNRVCGQGQENVSI